MPDRVISMTTRMFTMTGMQKFIGSTWRGLMVALCCLLAYGALAMVPEADTGKARVDIIRIDGLKAFGKLERPSVTYYHQRHTEALAAKNKDCTACHLLQENRLVFKFMRLEDAAKQAVMNVYHDNCIECHRATAAAGEKSGPVVCAACHVEKEVASAWQPIGMDKSLHYRHVKARENKCEQCHHEYDEAAKKLVYVKGREGTCRYCHQEEKKENRISWQGAAHLDCVNCHRTQLAQNKDAGPITCSGCHGAAEQQLIETLENVPRIQRNQPDVVLIRAHPADAAEPPPPTRLNAVPFDHLAHEAANDTCRVCHHADLNACVSCHTTAGVEKGGYVNLQDAMHRIRADASCIGCHTRRQAEPACAGCHAAMPDNAAADQTGCLSCHMELPSGMEPMPDDKTLARMLLDSRRPVQGTYDQKDIPDIVEIGGLSQKYDPVKMPHRRMVNKLTANIADNELAANFHRGPGTLCQGCHHNSPASTKPPKCISCHGKPFDERDPMKPGLMAAYHVQCMGCHKDMGIERPVATNCTACHRAKI